MMVWVFFFNFYDFATNLGEGAEQASSDEKTKFIGEWITEYMPGDERFVGNNGVYIFSSDETGSIGGLPCTWELSNGQLLIDYYEGFRSITYDYSFSNDDNILTLTNSIGTLEFTKI